MKIYSGFCIGAAVLGLAWAGQVQAENVSGPSSVLVCRAHQCAAASYSMTRGFLFNKLSQMMSANAGKRALLCEADPVSHVCLREGIHIPAQAAFATTDIVIPSVNIVDTKLTKGQPQMDVVLDYQVSANQTVPRCAAVVSQLSVAYVDKVEWMTPDFTCHMTETGRTSLNATFNIDYIDFDYGFIGAYYTIGVGESVRGEGSGYVLMRLTEQNIQPPEPVVIEEVVIKRQVEVPEKAIHTAAAASAKKIVVIPGEPKIVSVPENVKESVVADPVKDEAVTVKTTLPARSVPTRAVTVNSIQARPAQVTTTRVAPVAVNEVTPISREPIRNENTPIENAGQILNDLLYLETPKND